MLQFCDFFGCVLSCWVTLVSLADWRAAEPTLHVLGALVAAAGVRWRPTALAVFLAPVLLAAAVPVRAGIARRGREGGGAGVRERGEGNEVLTGAMCFGKGD